MKKKKTPPSDTPDSPEAITADTQLGTAPGSPPDSSTSLPEENNSTLQSSSSDPVKEIISSMDEMSRVKAIGELSTFNKNLNSFNSRQLSEYNSSTPPPGKEELQKRWEKEFSATWSSPEVEELAKRQIESRLSSAEIELRQTHELEQIQSAKSAWISQLEESRLAGDEETTRHWEELGRGVFFSEQDTERQHNLTKRHQFLKEFKSTFNDSPSQALKLLSEENETAAALPSTVKNYLSTQAKKVIAQRQETFARSLIENELQGTPLAEDSLKLAVEKDYISNRHAQLYREQFSPDRPIKNNEALKLPLLTQTRELIDSYSPDNDLKGERKRSILSLIASADYEPAERKSLLKQLDTQINNPGIARLKNTAHTKLKKLFEKNALGCRSSDTAMTKEQWISSQKKLNAAQQAINNYLDSKESTPPSPEEWENELSKIIYKSTRERNRLDIKTLNTIGGYPLNTTPPASKKREDKASLAPADTPPQISSSWDETLDHFFSRKTEKNSGDLRDELSHLFNDWLQQRHSPPTEKN